jgi:hypothetical protein
VRILTAVGLLMNVMHQPLPVVEALPLKKLYVLAELAAVMSGRQFK